MTDLETRVRDTLTDRAGAAGEWRVPGEVLRGAAADRASSRRRTAAAAAGALVVAGVVGVAVWSGDGPRDAAPADPTPTPSPTSTRVDGSPLQVAVPDDVVDGVRDRLGLAGASLAGSFRLPGSGHTGLLLTADLPPTSPGRRTAFTVTLDGTTPLAGTAATQSDSDEVVALPARDGDDTVLVVLVPDDWDRGVVEVTVSATGQKPVVVSRPVIGRLAVVPVPDARAVTELRVLSETSGAEVYTGIPGGALLRLDTPAQLPWIVARADRETGQSVQVRTDGRTACRMTVNGLDGPESFALGWDIFDVACATADGDLHLLIAEDRRYSSVAGIVPPGTESVRLTWRSGSDSDVTETPVRNPDEDVPAFVDESGHRPDQLTRAEALDADGDVAATVLP